ncbi:MAG TPA: isoprenylcysteine carboxylmethyltransferase family protein [Candidatus Eremiobacteraceae bacterium]|nr:isoprenylcysteine carboxylmethyltransferase family protein [Candidatus Eremiobacteraceae bacterium]
MSTPWDFRYRGILFGALYGLAFFLGFIIQSVLGGKSEPTYAVVAMPFGDGGVRAGAWIATALCFAGFLIRWWGASYLTAGVVWSGDVVAGGVEVAGPFRFVRNPLYVGNLVIALGIGLAGPPAVTVLVIAFNVAYIRRLIDVEERFLALTQGESYDAYRKAVPRLVPRLHAVSLGSSGRPPAIVDGLLGELFTLGFAVGMGAIALWSWRAPNYALMEEIWIGGLALQIGLRQVMRRAGATS